MKLRRRNLSHRFQPSECLESRLLLSGNKALETPDFGEQVTNNEQDGTPELEIQARIRVVSVRGAGVLKVSGTNHDDIITLDQQGNDILVRVTDRAGQILAEQLVAGSTISMVEVLGGFGHDVIRNNTNRPATLFGNDGNDDIRGGSATDIIFGGVGNDLLVGGDGNDVLNGESGDDRLRGDAGIDTLNGAAGNDTYLFAGGTLGHDIIVETGGDPRDQLDFSAMSGPITSLSLAATGQQVVSASHLQLTLASGGIEDVRGTEFADLIIGNHSDNTIYGLGGHDVLFGTGGNNEIFGGGGNDTIYGSSGVDILRGGAGNDTLYGRENNDQLFGEHGDDNLIGDDGSDLLDGGWGNDSLWGREGDDTLLGSFGDDVLRGEDGNDRLEGGQGDDTTDGGIGYDIHIYAGAWLGDDTVEDHFADINHLDFTNFLGNVTLDLVTTGRQTVHSSYLTLDLNVGIEYVTGSQYDDVILGNGYNNHFIGGGGNDLLDGRDGNDVLRGGTGDDTLRGGWGNDFLFGDDGHDSLCDGLGIDWLEGGRGNDVLSASSDGDLDRLFGQEGDDILFGADSIDQLWGGADDDWFIKDPQGTIMDKQDGEKEGEGGSFIGIGFKFEAPAPRADC